MSADELAVSDRRRMLSRWLLSPQLDEDEAISVVANHPAIRAAAHPPQPDALPGDLRERVARIIDPSAFLFSRDELDAKVRHHPHDAAYAIADAILSLIQSERGGA